MPTRHACTEPGASHPHRGAAGGRPGGLGNRSAGLHEPNDEEEIAVNDIMQKLTAGLARMFPSKAESASEPEAETWPPVHLRELVAQDVERIARRIRGEWPAGLPYTLGLELSAWAETKNAHDARRVERALRYCYGRVEIADEIRDLIGAEERR
jgi:hypothetical protein